MTGAWVVYCAQQFDLLLVVTGVVRVAGRRVAGLSSR